MDAHRFDAFTKSLGSGAASRRRLLARVGAATLGAALDRPCKGFGERCNKDAACCAGKCSPEHVCHCRHEQYRCQVPTRGVDTCCPAADPDCCCGPNHARCDKPGQTKPITVCCPGTNPDCCTTP